MKLETWRRANELFEEILDLSPTEQSARLDIVCADDPNWRREVEQRLQADAEAEHESFLGHPVSPPPVPAERAETAPQPKPPEHLGPYRVLHQVGQGGMGTVYAAERDDDAFHRQVAIKVITAGLESREIVRRMQTERRILALLEHPNIARIYDAGTTEEGLPYFVMEYVAGEPIDQHCASRESSIEERVVLIRKVCSAVDYANQNLVVHRDLKPSNILVTPEGEPKLLDFGIAKLLEPATDPAIDLVNTTAPWRQRLTLNYASPEQIRGQTISTASDVYAVGVLLFQLLTGSLPRSLEGLTPWEAEQRLTSTEPKRPSTAAVESKESVAAPPGDRHLVSRQLQGDLDSIVLKALRSEASTRYPSAAQLAEDLDRYLHSFPVLAHRGSLRYRSGKFLRRYRLATTLAGTALLLAIAFVGSTIVSANRLARSQDRLLNQQAKLQEVLNVFLGVFRDAGPFVAEGVDLTVRQAVDRNASRVDVALEEQPEVLAEVLSTFGWIYLELGGWQKAHDFHRRALELRQNLGVDSTEIAESLDGVAAALREQLQFEEADEISAAALELYRSHPLIPPQDLLRGLNNRVALFCLNRDWQAADPLSSEALKLSREHVDAKEPEATKALIQRALVLRQQGDLTGARELYLRAETAYTRQLGPNHPILATLFNNLGRLEKEAERPEAAAEYWQRADTQYIATFGEDFYDRIRPLTNLGTHFHLTGDRVKAEEKLRTALEIAVHSPVLGPKHEISYFGRPAIALAKLLSETNRCSEVLSLLGAKIARWEQDSSGTVVSEGQRLLEHCRLSS